MNRAIGPLVHKHPQVQIVVHGIIMELFLLNLVDLVFEAGVDPLDEVKHLDRLCEELVVYLSALNDVQSQDVLQLHYKLVQHLAGHN